VPYSRHCWVWKVPALPRPCTRTRVDLSMRMLIVGLLGHNLGTLQSKATKTAKWSLFRLLRVHWMPTEPLPPGIQSLRCDSTKRSPPPGRHLSQERMPECRRVRPRASPAPCPDAGCQTPGCSKEPGEMAKTAA